MNHADEVVPQRRPLKVLRRRLVEVDALLRRIAPRNVQYPAPVQAVPSNDGARVGGDSVGVVPPPLWRAPPRGVSVLQAQRWAAPSARLKGWPRGEKGAAASVRPSAI